jgi:hypothetical protein
LGRRFGSHQLGVGAFSTSYELLRQAMLSCGTFRPLLDRSFRLTFIATRSSQILNALRPLKVSNLL